MSRPFLRETDRRRRRGNGQLEVYERVASLANAAADVSKQGIFFGFAADA